jgi:hypothetical protein
MFNGKIHYKWPFSIAMLVITRGYVKPMCFTTGSAPVGSNGNVSPGLHLLRHQLGELRIGEVIAEALHGDFFDGNDGLKLRRS